MRTISKLYKGLTSLLVLFALLLTSGAGIAQEAWTLERCMQYAIDNNIQIKQQTLNVNYRENEKEQALYDMAPTLNGYVAHNFNFGRSLNSLNSYENTNAQSSSFGISSDVVLFQSLAKQNTLKKNAFEWQAALYDLDKAKDDIALNVVSAYLDILFNKELVNTSKEQLIVTQQQIEYNKRQVEAGNLAKGKLYETEAQAASEELTLTNYENQLKLSIITLQQMLDLQLSDTFDIVIPDFTIDNISAGLQTSDVVFDKAVNERPEIKSKEMSLNSYEKQMQIAKAYLYPSLSMGFDYSDSYYSKERDLAGTYIPFMDQIKNKHQYGIGFTLSIPVFNGFSAQTNVKNAKISYENSKYELQATKNALRKEIEQAYANAVAAMKKYYSSEKAVNSTVEAFRYVQEKFNLGIVTPLEFNDSKNKVSAAKSSFIQAKYEYIFRVKILDFYNGVDITL
jgi:outer membrane protein